MGVERIAQIARHVLLQLRPELSARPDEQVLQRDCRENEDDDVPQRRLRARRRNDEAVAQLRYAPPVIALLIYTRWLDPQCSEDPKAIGEAVSQMLAEAALFLPKD